MSTTLPIEDICKAHLAGYKRGLSANPELAQAFLRESVTVYHREDLKEAFRTGFQTGLEDGRAVQGVHLAPEVAEALLSNLRSYQEGFKTATLLVIDAPRSTLETVAQAQGIGDLYQANKGQPYCDGFRAILRVMQLVAKQPRRVVEARMRTLQQIEEGTLRSTPIAFATRE